MIPDRFEILEELVSDEVERLVSARDTELEREVVLKMPGPGMVNALRTVDGSDRALREARTLARVRHPGVPRVLDVLELPTGPLLVMEPVAGHTLAQELRTHQRLAPERAREIGIQLAQALAAVHAQGVVHRNVCTAAIVLRPDGTPCLTGFRLAKFDIGSTGTSIIYTGRSGSASGTATFRREDGMAFEAAAALLPEHPAPEQLMGLAADERCDVFGLGCVLYDCLTGELAYPQDDPSTRAQPEPPHKRTRGVSRKLSQVVMQSLDLRPSQRLPSAQALEQALEGAAGSGSLFGWLRGGG